MTKNIISQIVKLFILIILTSCSEVTIDEKIRNVKNYYFSVPNSGEQFSYKYVNESDSTDTFTWRLSSKILNEDTLLISEGIGYDNKPYDKFVERITINGAEFIDMVVLKNNKLICSSTYSNGSVFLWDWELGDSVIWNVKYDRIGDDSISRIIKTRTLIGQHDKIRVGLNEHETIKFVDHTYTEYINSEREKFSVEQINHLFFANGIGLFEMRCKLENDDWVIYKLADVKITNTDLAN